MARLSAWGWLHPNAWLWAGVPLALVLLYLIRPRHQPQVVTAAFLWQRVERRLAGQSGWRRLQRDPLLLLQLLFCFLLILALLGPYQVRPGRLSAEILILVDTSASMQAGGRLQQARREIERLIAQAPRGCRFLLAGVDDEVRVLHPFSDQRVALLEKLGQLEVRALGGRDALVGPFVLSLLKHHPQAQLHWFSDHPLEGVPHTPHLYRTGQRNYAVESLQGDAQELFAAVRNHSPDPVDLRLRLRWSQSSLERSLALRGQGRAQLHLPVAGMAGPFTLEILNSDDLDLDNRAYCWGRQQALPALLVKGKVSPFLVQACEAALGVGASQNPPPTSQMVSLLGEPLGEGDGLQILATPPREWRLREVEDQGPLRSPPEVEAAWGFSLTAQRWGKRWQGKLPGCRYLLTTPSGQPLLVEQGSRLVWLFDPQNSELPLTPQLPALISAWLQEQRPSSRGGQLLTGQRVGEFRPTWPGFQGEWAVNFWDPQESSLALPAAQAVAAPGNSKEITTLPLRQEWGWHLAALAWLLLLWEFACWRRA